MTEMIQANPETKDSYGAKAQEWPDEIGNIYADMKVTGVNVSGAKISFQAGFSGMDNTDYIKQKNDEGKP